MTAPSAVGLLDTSIFIALESRHSIDTSQLPVEQEISVITIAELQVGVLAAADPETRARRLATLVRAAAQDPLLIDARVASA